MLPRLASELCSASLFVAQNNCVDFQRVAIFYAGGLLFSLFCYCEFKKGVYICLNKQRKNISHELNTLNINNLQELEGH
jgi:hypothetical protein